MYETRKLFKIDSNFKGKSQNIFIFVQFLNFISFTRLPNLALRS